MHTLLKNKTTLVTGVTSGIGREIAQLLAERGARVFGTVRNPQSANHEVRRFGVRAVLIEPAYTKTKINGHAKSA